MRVNTFRANLQRYFLMILSCFWLFLYPLGEVAANTPALKEHHVKAKYIDGFTAFIKWPSERFATPTDVLFLCILGDNPFGEALDVFVEDYNEHIDEEARLHKVVYLRRGDNLNACHLLYISDSEESYVYQVLAKVKGKSILTISSIKDFATNGGMIQFFIRDNKVRFLIEPQNLRDEKLVADANLLRIAELATK